MTNVRKNLNLLVLLAFLAGSFLPALPAYALPDTGHHFGQPALETQPNIVSKKAKSVVSVSAENLFTYAVTQSGNKAPDSAELVGQYAYAAGKGSYGFIAHNYLAGASFYGLTAGTEVVVTFSDGSSQNFVVQTARRYQATDPNDYSKPFIDGQGKQLTARQVFNQNYKTGQVTFQTCITKDGSNTWGLVFIIAKPMK